jgi:asparagine synthase (glutamine-hydrolysing)
MDAALATHFNAESIFTGVGGDQLFFELRRWWPAADYLRLRGFDTGFLSAAMDAARLGQLSVWQTIGLAIAHRAPTGKPLPLERTRATLIHADVLDDIGHLQRTGHPAMFPTPDLPIGKLNQTRLLLSPLGYYDPFEREAAPEQVSPLLSQPLVELCLRLPTYLLTLGGRGRGLARTAFAADLPPEIAARRSKGGIDDLIKRVLLQNLVFARGILLDGELVRRRILDPVKLEKALSLGPTASASSVAEIHVLIGIEAWILRHRSVSSPPPKIAAADVGR